MGTKLADLLVQKMKQGVEVRIVLDAAGSKPYGPTEPMFTRLADAGAQIVVNDTFPPDKDGLYPNHRSSTGARTTSAVPTTASST